MLSKVAAEKFFSGAFGKVFPRALVEQIENLREGTEAAEANQRMTFDFEAEEGETIIEVTLTLKVVGLIAEK